MDFLQQQKNHVSEALVHQDMAIESVLQQCGYTRPTAYTPIAQVGFNYLQQESALADFKLDKLQITAKSIEWPIAKSEMTWIFYPSESSFACSIEFNTALFKESTMTRWFGYFTTLLEQVLEDSDRPIERLTILNTQQVRQQLQLTPVQSFMPLTPMQRDIFMHSLFYPQAKQNHIGYFSVVQASIDLALWRESLQLLYQHNQVLRASMQTLMVEQSQTAYMVSNPVSALAESIFSTWRYDEPLTEDLKTKPLRNVYTRIGIFRNLCGACIFIVLLIISS